MYDPCKVQLETSNPLLDEEIECMQIRQLRSVCSKSAGEQEFKSLRFKNKMSHKNMFIFDTL